MYFLGTRTAADNMPPPHSHLKGTCPVTGETNNANAWCPAQPGDSRSCCPALNTMANHGYINRSGKDISYSQIAKGLKACYGTSTFLSYFLAYGGLILIRQWGKISLSDLARHGGVEHDASLAHKDTPEGGDYAPLPIDPVRFEEAMKWMTQSGEGLIEAVDVGRARVNREKQCKPLDAVHAEIARGEMALILGFFNPDPKPYWSIFLPWTWFRKPVDHGIPADYVREWLGDERLPLGGTWRPSGTQGFFQTVKKAKEIKKTMDAVRAREGDSAKGGALWVAGNPGVQEAQHDVTTSNGMTPDETTSIFSKPPQYGAIHHSKISSDSTDSSSSTAPLTGVNGLKKGGGK